MAKKRTLPAYYVGDSDEHAKNWLASLWEYLTKRVQESGDARHLAAQELIRAAWATLDGEVDPEPTLKAIRKSLPEAVIYPRSKAQEFARLGDAVEHILKGTVDGPDDASERARVMALYLTEVIQRRVSVSIWLRQFVSGDHTSRTEECLKAVQRVLLGYKESDWPRQRARVIRAALRALGADEGRFRNDEFEPAEE